MPVILLLLGFGPAASGDDASARRLEADLEDTRSGGSAGRHDELVIRPAGELPRPQVQLEKVAARR